MLIKISQYPKYLSIKLDLQDQSLHIHLLEIGLRLYFLLDHQRIEKQYLLQGRQLTKPTQSSIWFSLTTMLRAAAGFVGKYKSKVDKVAAKNRVTTRKLRILF